MALLDADQELIGERATNRFADDVEAVRAGTLLAHDQKAYDRWRSRSRHVETGKPLSQLVKDLGGQPGIQVVHGEFEFRN